MHEKNTGTSSKSPPPQGFSIRDDSDKTELMEVVASKMRRTTNFLGTGLHSCLECGYTSKVRSNVIDHVEAKHLRVWYQCDQCDYVSYGRNPLRVHKYRRHRAAAAAVAAAGGDTKTT